MAGAVEGSAAGAQSKIEGCWHLTFLRGRWEMNEHVTNLKTYFLIFGILLLLTAVTTWVSFINIGHLNTLIAMIIAFSKAVLVVLFFMHVRHSSRLTKIVVTTALLWLIILFGLTLSDYFTRNWFDSGWNR
jgi:cytochrome c oxidase subunit 4